ncbi:gamma-glutamyltransferase [Lichenicoccus roseus]|uniref:Glutathione hydrolase proenzyme n=2 Tax=Lichenicoccus roseus TaxID=2683649 RepID=A0A5R9JCF6_9PROT|nr:gamma-glutamyltransferase [Lichenicoccus roseus]
MSPERARAADPLASGGGSPVHDPAAPVGARHGMVVTAQALASRVGAQVLAQGGNAVDAAVAVGYALAVVYPVAGNIGGGGFMTLRQPNGHAVFLDFRERAPLSATATMFQDADGKVVPGLSERGWKAVGVPGSVLGFETALRDYGSLPRATVMAPAIGLARDGFVLGPDDVALLDTTTAGFKADPASRRVFLRPDGTRWQAGDRLIQADLARTLEAISEHGPQAFYDGPTARAIVDASSRAGGLLSMRDFAAYKVRTLKPLTCTYRGFHVDTAPPPSGGGVALCEILEILSGYDMARLGFHTPAAIQREVEAMRHAYSDRQGLGDPQWVHDPVAHLVDPAYAAAIRRATPTDRATPSAALVPLAAASAVRQAQDAGPHEKQETTHYSIIDRNGEAVSVTYTLNGWFGAQVMAPDTGVMLNDEMDDFASKAGAANMYGLVGSAANAVAPGKTPLSSMSPTILSRNGHVVMVIGSPGGSRIPTITLSAILGVVDYHRTIQQAIDDGRIHEQWRPEPVEVERGALPAATIEALSHEGYVLQPHAPWGSAQGILVGGPALGAGPVDGNLVYGGIDRRHPGAAAIGE